MTRRYNLNINLQSRRGRESAMRVEFVRKIETEIRTQP